MALQSSKRTYDAISSAGTPIFSNPFPSKRPRSDNSPSLWNQILTLPQTTTHSLLYQICTANPSLMTFVQSAYDAHVAEEAARPPVEFDRYSKECWFAMNSKYKSLSCSKQFEMMGDICEVLDESREKVVEAAQPGVRWETRRNALEVLRKISKSIMLCDEPQIRHELMKDGFMLGQFADSMQELVRGMTAEEKSLYKEEGLYEKLLELQNECDSMDMEGLQEVYAIFDGAEEDEDEEGGENEDEADFNTEYDEEEELRDYADGEGGEGERGIVDLQAVSASLTAAIAGRRESIDGDSPHMQQMPRTRPVIPTISQPKRTSVFSVHELS